LLLPLIPLHISYLCRKAQWCAVDAFQQKVMCGFCHCLSGDGTVHRGEILAYKSETGQHQVFYEDGEDEWVDLAAQKVKSWQAPARGLVTAPGLPEGQFMIAQHAL